MGIGQSKTYKNTILNFDDMKQAIDRGYTICHIMEEADEGIIIKNTLSVKDEIKKINDFLQNDQLDGMIVLYGRNYTDIDKLAQRQKQLNSLGFMRVFIYVGGLYEWVLLQNVYGDKLFPTNRIFDILEIGSIAPQRCQDFV